MTSGAVQIATSDEIKHTLERYGERVYTYYGEANEGAENIAARWELFKALHSIGIERLYEAMREEYKPLDNYNMTERGTNTDIYTDSMKRTGTVTAENSRENTTEDTRTATTNNTGTVTSTDTGTVTSTDTGTVTSADTGTVTDSTTSNTNNSVYAYDSTAATPHDTTATTSENTRTDNTTNTRTDNTTNTRTDDTTNTRTDNTTEQTTHGGTVTDNESGTTTTTNDLTDSTEHSGESEHTLTRSGNIGVTTSQQMLESEISLRVKNSVIYYAVELFVAQNCTW